MIFLKRILIQILIIVFLFVEMLAVLGRDDAINNRDSIPFVEAVSRGWNILFSPRAGVSTPVTPTEETTGPVQCAYQWSSQPLPDVSNMLQQKFTAAGVKKTTVMAEAFGEDCIDPASGAVIRFITKQTDIRIRSEVESISDQEKLGNLLSGYLEIIFSIPDSLPGPQTGMIGVSFHATDGDLNLWFPAEGGRKVLENGIKGHNLISELQN